MTWTGLIISADVGAGLPGGGGLRAPHFRDFQTLASPCIPVFRGLALRLHQQREPWKTVVLLVLPRVQRNGRFRLTNT